MVAPLPSSTTPHGEFCCAPRGPGLLLREAAFLVAYLEHQTSLLVPCLAQKTGYGAAANEAETDPIPKRADLYLFRPSGRTYDALLLDA